MSTEIIPLGINDCVLTIPKNTECYKNSAQDYVTGSDT